MCCCVAIVCCNVHAVLLDEGLVDGVLEEIRTPVEDALVVARPEVVVGQKVRDVADLQGSRNTVRGYCLDIPRFEESLNN